MQIASGSLKLTEMNNYPLISSSRP